MNEELDKLERKYHHLENVSVLNVSLHHPFSCCMYYYSFDYPPFTTVVLFKESSLVETKFD